MLPNIRDSMQDLQAAGGGAGGGDAEAGLPRAASDNSIYGIEVAREEEKSVVDALARHVVYSKLLCTTVNSRVLQ